MSNISEIILILLIAILLVVIIINKNLSTYKDIFIEVKGMLFKKEMSLLTELTESNQEICKILRNIERQLEIQNTPQYTISQNELEEIKIKFESEKNKSEEKDKDKFTFD
jgi:hypothetical protein